MPLKEKQDFGGGNTTSVYCRYCTYEDGTLKPYELKHEELTRFIKGRSGATIESARKTAKENLSKMPAWKNIGK